MTLAIGGARGTVEWRVGRAGSSELNEGGAALQWSSERPQRRWPVTELAGSRSLEATGGGRASGGHQDAQKLTAELLVSTARRGEAGNGGERWRPAARAPVDWVDWELLCWRHLVEE
jgi:hypothetical protein